MRHRILLLSAATLLACACAEVGASADAATYREQLRGVYEYRAAAGWFIDCATRMRLAVAKEGDNAALEAAFAKARKTLPDAPMLATVQGHIEPRLPMQGLGRPTLIVEKFVGIESGECPELTSTAVLENTYWKLMTLGGAAVETPEGAREIHFVLNREMMKLNGFAGCNRMTGSYCVDGAKLTFSGIAGTMMACAGGMETEQRFNEMLARVMTWKITGETLQLFDAGGQVLATFESRYMK